ncbi:MAG: hypothetical protein L3J96_07005, partial [Thermoplasmata archaeon]|nr:hypothetical protein [Thermoplasmata archaeon]
VLVPGTVWTVKVGSLNVTSSGPFLNVTGLGVGTYTLSVAATYSPDGATRYVLQSPPPPVHLSQNYTLPFALSPSFWVALTASSGGTVPALGGWYAPSASLVLNASPSDGYQFVSWVGSGTGSYSGANLTQSVTVTAPIQEVATFETIPASSGASTSGTSTTTWALIGVGLVLLAAAVVVIVLPRMRRPPQSDASPEPGSAEEAAPQESYEYQAEP